MATLRMFGTSLTVTVVALLAGYVHGGLTALFLLGVLAVLEVSLSFDNAIVNAAVLHRMSPFWQQMFLTIGILIAVFGMRLSFPLVVVWATAGLDPVRAMDLALHPPPAGALEFPDGSPSYAKLITEAHPQIAAFGGTFLLILFLDFVFHDRDVKWLKWVEIPFARVGRLANSPVVVAGGVLLVVTTLLTHSGDHRATVLTAGVLGLLVYLSVNGLSKAFQPSRTGPAPGAGSMSGAGLVMAAGKVGFSLFLYLEVLDAAFSVDGVTAAFAVTSDPIIITLGLGLVGAMFVRSITICLVRQGTLDNYVYLEHGAHWAIGALAVILLLSVDRRLQIPEVATALVGVVFVGAAFGWSVLRNRHDRSGADPVPPLAGVREPTLVPNPVG